MTADALWPLYVPAHTCTYPALTMYSHLRTHAHAHTKQTNKYMHINKDNKIQVNLLELFWNEESNCNQKPKAKV